MTSNIGKKSRREFLKAAGLWVSSLVFSGCMEASQKPRKKPNIVIFFTDDQQYDSIAALGNNQVITPNLNGLVRNGTSFTNAYIMGSMTGAVCMPSRAMLMTGKTLFRFERDAYIIPEHYVTLPQLLRKRGYTTFHAGKWHQSVPSHGRSFSDGGKVFFGGMSDHYRVPAFDFDPEMKYPSRDELRELRKMKNVMKRKKGKHSTGLFTDSAIEFLRGYKDKRPFFVYISYTGPHQPWQAPEKYLKMYDVEKIELPESFMPEHPFDLGELILDERTIERPRTKEKMRRSLRNYYAMITHIDAQIGRVLKALKERGDFENTIVIFSSDNGLAMGRHGLVGKQSLYEHSMKVPLIMAGPGIAKGQKRDGLCYLLDIYPTLCEMAGMSVPNSVEGKSFRGLIRGSKQEIRKSLFFAYKDFQRGVREGRHKLIEYVVDGKRTTQLFDLQTDPREINNLADKPNYRKILQHLRKELLRWKDELDDKSSFWKHFDATN
jgi:arylsulfatase A-like enzyme